MKENIKIIFIFSSCFILVSIQKDTRKTGGTILTFIHTQGAKFCITRHASECKKKLENPKGN